MTANQWIELGMNVGLALLILGAIAAFYFAVCLYAARRDQEREAAGEHVPRSMAPLAARFFPVRPRAEANTPERRAA